MRSLPWKLLQLADPRATHLERTTIANELYELRMCCLPPGLARSIRLYAPGPAALLDAKWTMILFSVAQLMNMSVAEVERRHSRNRTFGKDGSAERAS